MTNRLAGRSEPPRWGMVIDVNRCVGCQTCTVACKHWNDTQPGVQWRSVIDVETGRYPNVERFFLVVGCQHCAVPPCVPVCPTGATQQRDDGLVTMNYDTCIGCAACAVACPYDARTIAHEHQWYYGTETLQEESARHPEREGVAQKCTFCVDKVDEATARELDPGVDFDVMPACAASCISNAIYFGDFNNPTSNVSTLVRDQPTMRLNEDLGTDPQIKYLYSTPTVPGRDADADDLDEKHQSDPTNPLVGKRQNFWDWRATMNWCLGGLGSGLAVSAWVAYVIGQISMQATHQLQLIAGVMMLAGLFFVWLKLGRRWRAWRALWRPQTSWMTRELYAAGVFLISVLVTTQISQPVVGLYHLAGFAAACFLLCQARILYSAQGIPAWRTLRVPWLIVASGLLEGVGLTLLLASTNMISSGGSVYLDPSRLAGVMAALALLNTLLWLGYRYGADRAARPPLANRIVDNMSWPLLIVGHLAPVLLALAAWLDGANSAALFGMAGFLAMAGGPFWKYGLILKASYQHGFSLSRLPQRGSGTRAAPSLVA